MPYHAEDVYPLSTSVVPPVRWISSCIKMQVQFFCTDRTLPKEVEIEDLAQTTSMLSVFDLKVNASESRKPCSSASEVPRNGAQSEITK